MDGEFEYITKKQLVRNGFHGLIQDQLYEMVQKIDENTVTTESFIQASFLIQQSGKQRIFFKMDGVPKYFSGLFSLYAIIRAAKIVTDKEKDFVSLGVIDEIEYQEIMIEYLPAKEHTTGLELLRTIEVGRTMLAKKIKEDLLAEVKNYNLIDSMDFFL